MQTRHGSRTVPASPAVAPRALGLAVLGALAAGCPGPQLPAPTEPAWRMEVVRASPRASGGLGQLALALDEGGQPLLAFNDGDHQAVGLARPTGWTWRVDYPVERVSWHFVGVACGGGSRARIQYVEAPRTVVTLVWDGRSAEEAGREAPGEDAFGALRAEPSALGAPGAPAHAVRLDGTSALASDHPSFGPCGHLEARSGHRLSGSTVAAALDGSERPRLLYVEEPFGAGASGGRELRYATCESGRWAVFTVSPVVSVDVALAVDGRGHPHLAFVRPGAGGGAELVHATTAAPPPRPPCPPGQEEVEGRCQGTPRCPEGTRTAAGACEPVDSRIAAGFEACARIEVSDRLIADPHASGDGFRCAVLARDPALGAEAFGYAAERCEAGDWAGCLGAAALLDGLTASTTFDPVLCTPPPGGVCSDHVLQVTGIDFDHVARDLGRARGLYGRACDGGLGQACLRLAGLALSSDRDDGLAYRAARPACEAGHLAACAMAVEATRASTQDGAEAVRRRAATLFSERCEAGQPSGCANLGYMLVRGEAGTADPARARALFDRGCAAGHRPSCTSARELASR